MENPRHGILCGFLGGRYVDVDSAEVLIHGMYATQRHPEIHTLSPSTIQSGVLVLRKDAELMPQLCWVELYS